MNTNRFSTPMLLFLIAVLGYLAYQIICPFLTTVAWQWFLLLSSIPIMPLSAHGGATVALIQGILGSFAYYVIGMESPVMRGVAMAVMSFVPLLGTFSIWGPGSIVLLLSGSYVKSIGLFLFGVFVISMIDNILRPLIIGSRTNMPTILILFSVLGGIKLFGMIGFVMGPLIMAAFITFFEIFRRIEDEKEEEVGSGEQH